MHFFPTNDFSLLESCQLYIIANYKASSCCNIEAVIQRCSFLFNWDSLHARLNSPYDG